MVLEVVEVEVLDVALVGIEDVEAFVVTPDVEVLLVAPEDAEALVLVPDDEAVEALDVNEKVLELDPSTFMSLTILELDVLMYYRYVSDWFL